MVLELKNYKAKYNKDKFFAYPDIELYEGSCLCLMGSSGCGKTTLLSSLFSIEFLGEVEYDVANLLGKDINSLKENKYGYLSYMPQYAQDALNPLLNIGQQIQLIMKSNKNNIRYENIKSYLEELELGKKVMKMYPHELSGGMKQRVVMLLGFVKNPKLFILDEPSSALDYITLFSIVKFLKKRKEEGTSLFIVSHDEIFVKNLADKVYRL